MSHAANETDAAVLVRAERARLRRLAEAEAEAAAAAAAAAASAAKETVSEVGWIGTEAGDVDETELARRQRAIAEKLARKQAQLEKDGMELERVRIELASMESPLKAEIMSVRIALEDANKREKALVDAVNHLRSELYEKEKQLVTVRAEKQQYADKLIDVMADYEKRKTDILNGIAKLVGEDPVDSLRPAKPTVSKSNFSGF